MRVTQLSTAAPGIAKRMAGRPGQQRKATAAGVPHQLFRYLAVGKVMHGCCVTRHGMQFYLKKIKRVFTVSKYQIFVTIDFFLYSFNHSSLFKNYYKCVRR
jgi:hypothetical protein